MVARVLRTEVAKWLHRNGKTNEWLRDQLDPDATVASVQHWVSGRKPVPRKHRHKVAELLKAGVTDE